MPDRRLCPTALARPLFFCLTAAAAAAAGLRRPLPRLSCLARPKVFPKYDHVGVGTGTVVNRPAIKQYQKAIRERAGDKIAGGKIIKVT